MKNLADLAGGLLLLLLIAPMVGCEDTALTAPTDGSIIVTANPATVTIDPNAPDPPIDPTSGEFKATTTIVARVFNKSGSPQSGISILFSTSGGRLASGGSPGSPAQSKKTDANGIAQDVLTLLESDPDSVDVTAQSSALSQKVTVKKQVLDSNELPRATVIMVPQTQQSVGQPVTFDGSGSADPDGAITCFRWTLLSSHPDDPSAPNPEIIQGVAAAGFDRIFQKEQSLAITLQVSDVAAAADVCVAGRTVPAELFSPEIYALQYEIVCSNPAPVANAGPDQTQRGSQSEQTGILLDARNSSDDRALPATVDHYNWNCGNGTSVEPVNEGDYRLVICKYSPGTWTATLTVKDTGTGVFQNGTWQCQRTATDTASVTITVPQ